MTYEQKLQRIDWLRMTDSMFKDYWTGYQRGMQKAELGDAFSTDEEHHDWMSMTGDEQREACARGYRDGYRGETPEPGNNI
jgi:hypothetical protein